MALHSDSSHIPDLSWIDRLTTEQRLAMQAEIAERASVASSERAEIETAHVAAIYAVDLSTAVISADVDFDGELTSWQVDGLKLGGNFNPIYTDWVGHDEVLAYCKTWARANKAQFIKNCIATGGKNAAYRISKNGVKL